MKRILVTILLIISTDLFSQPFSIDLFQDGKIKSELIKGYKEESIVYASINDLAKILSDKLTPIEPTLRQKIELSLGEMYVTAFNPFVLIKKSNGEEAVFQMGYETKLLSNEIYIPLLEFLNILNRSFRLNINFDENKNLITGLILQTKSIKEPTSDEIKFDKPIDKGEATNTKQYDIYDFEISEKSNGYLLRLKSNKPIKSVVKNLSGKTLFIQFKNISIDLSKFNTEIENGLISKISAVQNQDRIDLKLQLKETITSNEIVRETNSNDILILLYINPEIINKIREERKSKSELIKTNSQLDVIVIDPGHGGIDAGAIGYRGTLEKNINLKISLMLGELIEKNLKSVRVVYTRTNDTFVELYRRGQIANENKGKLFISIHCNSTDDRPGKSKGSSVYLLRPGRTEESIKIAERENSVIKLEQGYEERYKNLADENFILVAMSQTANVKNAEKFSEILNSKFNNLSIPNNGVKQAGFYVLVGASMPSVLIETAYINHPTDEQYLRSSSGQQEITNSIFEAIVEYKNYYERLVSK